MLWQAAWQLASSVLVMPWFVPPRIRIAVLRAFGAKIGKGVNFRAGVRVHWPWKLEIGDDSWIGERVWLLNLESIRIGSDVCVSQAAFLCTGSHDHRSPSFEFDNAPIRVEDGAWIAARATVLRGVTIGADAIVGATALVTKDVAAGAVALAPAAKTIPTKTAPTKTAPTKTAPTKTAPRTQAPRPS
ncbi:putative colanic acid biosynthesis acetyltransferase [Microbacterium suwonense]|uniref:putative colanic acid biosynthesis acetyltransferase n=1 Tax=Microbacterium suwonense TaxID=683047 RepID=UPI002572E511|nr:putative colanic acid biosynthesis acetyltransferase [Microbacterium suwonense]